MPVNEKDMYIHTLYIKIILFGCSAKNVTYAFLYFCVFFFVCVCVCVCVEIKITQDTRLPNVFFLIKQIKTETDTTTQRVDMFVFE
jgi:hypothetical protein